MKKIFSKLCLPNNALFRWLVFIHLSFFLSHMILRTFTLGRKNAFGVDFVSKFDWYIFHAWSFDFLFLFPPFLFTILWAFLKPKGLLQTVLKVLFLFSHTLILFFAILDQEVYRFLGGHFNKNIFETYGNATSIRETISFIAQDESIPFLGPAWFFILPLLSFFLFRFLSKRSKIYPRVFWGMLIYLSLSYLYTEHIWRGGFRMRKLEPGLKVFVNSYLNDTKLELTPAQFSNFSKHFQNTWQESQGDSNWVFSSPKTPFFKQPLHRFCSDNPLLSLCLNDFDLDGKVGAEDCSPWDPHSFLGAQEIPTNGVDENCDGIDEKPVNFLFFFLESHRAVHAGFLQKYGAWADATPFLNKTVPKAHWWSRFTTSGVPTIAALFATHLSIVEHPEKYTATSYSTLKQKSFVEHLRDFGYQTHFFTAADPAWDNQIPWLKQWYGGYSYDRNAETDQKMYRNKMRWMTDSLKEPFFMSSITKTNHYPFKAIDEMESFGKELPLDQRMVNTMRYTEEGLEKFFQWAEKQEWFSRTVFLISADHGFSLGIEPGEHNNGNIGNGLYSEHTWIPFLIFGNHPQLKNPQEHTFPASQVDIAPTILSLAGIQEPNHYIGHNLFRPNAENLSHSWFIRRSEGLFENDSLRLHFSISEEPRPYGNEIFHATKDRTELHNLYPLAGIPFDSIQTHVKNLGQLNTYLIENNLLLP